MIKACVVAVLLVANSSLAHAQALAARASSPLACTFVAERIAAFVTPAQSNGHRAAVDAGWLTLSYDRAELAAALAQDGRESAPGSPFGMAYNADFAAAVEGLTEDALDAVFAALTQAGPIACDPLETASQPFTDDIIGVQRWAEKQMMDPEPGAPLAVQTLSLSRPIFFNGDTRVLVAEAYTFTPIPISRPPSAFLGFTVYTREGGSWVREAGIIAQRMG